MWACTRGLSAGPGQRNCDSPGKDAGLRQRDTCRSCRRWQRSAGSPGGPDRLTVDGEMSISMTAREVLDVELEAFAELIEEINALGV
jgi:hypothetical protein